MLDVFCPDFVILRMGADEKPAEFFVRVLYAEFFEA
jgi:hypothetical protein